MKFYISKFKEIATKENGKFHFIDEGMAIGFGVRSPQATFQLQIPYKDYIIYTSNKVGTQYIGKFICKLPISLKALEFEIKTKTHLSTLFSLNKKKRFKIFTKNQSLYDFLVNNKSLDTLNSVAKTDIFEPMIRGEMINFSYDLKVTYHLEFDNWVQVLNPLIIFYKEVIDFIDSKNRNTIINSKRIDSRKHIP